ncbi:MAG: hypothetical protein IPM82_14300 [Saprospiraceae bacterium]|nr:hypothetical protein [Saprospiraceae bacterium]
MQNYLTHLLADIEAAILRRWQHCPPHFYQMGLPERWLEPPAGWDGPPPGYARNDDVLDDFFSELEDDDLLSNPLPPEETPSPILEAELKPDATLPPDPEFLATIEEVQDYLHGKPGTVHVLPFRLRCGAVPAARCTDGRGTRKAHPHPLPPVGCLQFHARLSAIRARTGGLPLAAGADGQARLRF